MLSKVVAERERERESRVEWVLDMVVAERERERERECAGWSECLVLRMVVAERERRMD